MPLRAVVPGCVGGRRQGPGAVGHLRAVYYRDPAGFEPVRDFVDALPEQPQAAVENQIARLNLLTDRSRTCPSHTARRSRESCGSCAATTDGASTESSTDARGDW